MLKYKGIEGQYKYNIEMKSFVGELKNTKFLVVFKGKTLKETERSFKKAVEQYLSMLRGIDSNGNS